MRSPTLRGQFSRVSMLTTAVALVLSAAGMLLYEMTTYRRAFIDDLQTQADLVAKTSAAALVFDDPRVAQQNLALLKQQPRIRAAAVFGADGRPFATYTASADEPVPLQPEAGGAGVHRLLSRTIEVVYPVEHERERVGSVYLRAAHDVWAKATTLALILAGVMAISLLLAQALFRRLQRGITEPLAAVAEVAQQVMERRDWTLRAPDAPVRDIALLVQAFNAMLDEVAERTGELEREMGERQAAEAELRQADRRKDEFLATLAHELRNPLAPIANAAALLRSPSADAATRELAHTILERQLRQMVRLIDDLLDVSRVTTGKLSLHAERIDLVAVLRAAIELAEPLARQHQLRLAAQLPPHPCTMHGDAARLSQVFSNLLNNACRYTPAGGQIDVTLEESGSEVEVAVRDTGIGVEPAMQQRVFELFEQANKRLERGNAGLGIGLTLARQLVQLHGGEITLESAGLGHGSTVRVRLPLKRAESAAAQLALTAPPAAGEPLRLLLADDNVDFAASLQRWLQGLGHEVTVVHDGAAALQAATAAPPDVAILDIGMPGLNGYDVARRLRADAGTAAVTLIAATGWGQRADKEAARQAGFDHHLVKPVDTDALLRILVGCAPALVPSDAPAEPPLDR
ncbi:response regulator [Aquincola sp. S2]|uniref:histidine kinase n=1 Tax=Pseudaquabacterium terrae TaxID=2732868 RepID=A0ABX2EHV8_9BURK|nr:ATP-binding protein [Aquabacterium terrae]NRF68185.1 response regulator [Aquabacterium terrae]